MAISFSLETKYNLKSRTLIKKWLKQIIENKGYKLGTLSYILCDDDYLLEINKQYLQHEFYTDIITFDYVENGVINGDIFISVDRVKENAASFGVSEREELMRVFAHGVLHLSGLKDATSEEASQMRKAENESLELLKELEKHNQ
ncbi:MAG: rRNA maturation RNase YbeY [Bacteroidales bacterium]|jgi:rRNA maturation RNase YbeY|nr:rRNA maturation RNase YbeY [Bacteroidales bacterium]MBO7229433.1 rRNA maturation RNase YbeY [Bacteroidales bacterium]MBQ2303732.1 rRNA maturation RNase YbeY [Bacteroidales bacterium]MEE0899671.1 rRNA maturation RNase YbeY [Bacteroidales bacterium]MEE0916689.1 rRNA maturation RNase YbeY [Bacteroidales bacterium]